MCGNANAGPPSDNGKVSAGATPADKRALPSSGASTVLRGSYMTGLESPQASHSASLRKRAHCAMLTQPDEPLQERLDHKAERVVSSEVWQCSRGGLVFAPLCNAPTWPMGLGAAVAGNAKLQQVEDGTAGRERAAAAPAQGPPQPRHTKGSSGAQSRRALG